MTLNNYSNCKEQKKTLDKMSEKAFSASINEPSKILSLLIAPEIGSFDSHT